MQLDLCISAIYVETTKSIFRLSLLALPFWERARIMDWDNKEWRTLWTLEMISRIAVHRSGLTARVTLSPSDPTKDCILLENTDNLDLSCWDLGELTEQVAALWLEGHFERV